MKRFSKADGRPVFVAIDVAKARHHVLIERADGKRTALSIANTLADFNKLAELLRADSSRCEVALEPTGDYHRPLANFLVRCGHNVQFVSSIATHRTREALFNSWDKNDSKDAQVILHLLKGGITQRYADPLQSGYQDLQESPWYVQPSRRSKDPSISLVNDTLSAVVLPRSGAISWQLSVGMVS